MGERGKGGGRERRRVGQRGWQPPIGGQLGGVGKFPLKTRGGGRGHEDVDLTARED